MEDYKEGYLMVWETIYLLVGLYFKGTCDVLSVTILMHKTQSLKIHVFIVFMDQNVQVR